MKNFIFRLFTFLGLILLLGSCQEDAPAPACLQVEVMGADCNANWYILKIENTPAAATQTNNYLGQLQRGYVTTDNLPEEYRQPGLKLNVALELNGEYGPRCVTVAVMYPAVKVTRVCSTPVTES